MRDGRTDRRPRVLDFSTRIGGAVVSRDLAWPCHAFRVSIPVRPASPINIFEEVVLKLLGNARLDEKTLAETLCVDASFIKLVCSRLRDVGLLTAQNDVTSLGREQLSDPGELVEHEVRYVFREQLSGQMLPIVYGGELRYEELSSWNEERRFVEIRKEDHKPVRLYVLRRDDTRLVRPPTIADVLWATTRHRTLSRQYAALRLGVAPCPHVAHADQLNVGPDPEECFLRCRVVLLASGGDYRIGDPFGYGFSEGLLRAYDELRSSDEGEGEQEFIRRLREAASTVRPRAIDLDSEERVDEAAVLARLSDLVMGHRALFVKLMHAEKELRRCEHVPRSGDEEAHITYHGQQGAQSLYEALEVALGDVVTRSRVAASETLLSGYGRTPQQNSELLEKLAEHLGFRAGSVGGLLRVPSGRVRALREGAVDLQALLAATIAAATEEQEHPLRRLANEFGNWFSFLRELKATRDAGAHGQTREAGMKRLGALREWTYRSIGLLMPSLVRESPVANQVTSGAAMDQAHEARRRAISHLEDRFGVRWYQGTGPDVAELFIQVEITVGSLHGISDTTNVVRVVNDLASLVQTLAHTRQSAVDHVWSEGQGSKELARKRAVEAHLLEPDEALPSCLATVNPRRLRAAVQGQNSTLGPTVVALLLLSSMEWLQALAVTVPGFLKTCARVIDLRKHGNRPLFLATEAVLKLKSEVYEACAALMEA